MMTVQISYFYLYEEHYESLESSSEKWFGFVRSYKINTGKSVLYHNAKLHQT